MLRALCLRRLQSAIILIARPNIIREFYASGKPYTFLVDYNWLWTFAPVKSIRGKVHCHTMRLDLSKWPDRLAYFLGRWYDFPTQLFLCDLIKPGDTVVDIGANRGMFAPVASRLVGSASKIICFEPNPKCLEALDEANVENQIKNVLVYHFGLGKQEAKLTLSVPPTNSGEGTFGTFRYDKEMTYQVNTMIWKGDNVLVDTGMMRPISFDRLNKRPLWNGVPMMQDFEEPVGITA